MKGAVAAMIAAAGFFAADTRRDFAGEIVVSGVVHEECFEGIAARKISECVKPDYVVIGESSELNLKRGQRGRAEIVVETFGKHAHSANPSVGINAVYKMAELIELCKVVAEFDGVFVVHQRSEADTILESMREVIRIGRESGVKVHFSHFKVCGRKN
jgi:acetylornithine deacetylase/succinyl-diaminopimelate desuccinylase-like protein